AVELAREVTALELDEPRADARAKLTGSALRVRDDEDRTDVEAVLADGTHEALDEHPRLSRSGSGRDEHEALRVDGRLLFGIQRSSCSRIVRSRREKQARQGRRERS